MCRGSQTTRMGRLLQGSPALTDSPHFSPSIPLLKPKESPGTPHNTHALQALMSLVPGLPYSLLEPGPCSHGPLLSRRALPSFKALLLHPPHGEPAEHSSTPKPRWQRAGCAASTLCTKVLCTQAHLLTLPPAPRTFWKCLTHGQSSINVS